LRVWELGAKAELGELLWDTAGRDFAVGEIAWAGTYLVYWRLEGVTNIHEFERGDVINPDPDFDLHKYIVDNSQTWLYDPGGRRARVLVANESGTLLTDASGETLVVCEPTSRDEDPAEDRWQQTIVNVYSMPDGTRRHSFAARIGYHMRRGCIRGPALLHPVFGNAGAKAFFAIGETEGPPAYGRRYTVGLEAATLIGLDGSVKFLTDGTTNRLVRYLRGLPAVVTLEDGQEAVACMLEMWGAVPWRLALFGVDGQRIREYSFGLRYGAVEKVTGRKTIWQPITVTPDGRYLLLQDTGLRGGLMRGQDGWVWMWNLEERTGRPLARLRGISAVYGWVHDEYLLVQLEAATGGDIADQGPLYVPWKTTHVQAVPPEQSRPEE